MKKLRVIVTGATGMVGEGVLEECLLSPEVESVLSLSRKPTGVTHPKLKEIIHSDFYNITPIEHELSGYDACYFCLGVSSIGKNEADYTKVTYTLTMHVADILSSVNKDMVFCYVSGAGTDSTEQGKSMWARVKGKTENDLAKLPFRAMYAYRPAVMKPNKGAKNVPAVFRLFLWMYAPMRKLFPGGFCSLKEVGQSMINITLYGYEKRIIDVKDIVELAKR